MYVKRDIEKSTFFSSLTYQNKKGQKNPQNNKKK